METEHQASGATGLTLQQKPRGKSRDPSAETVATSDPLRPSLQLLTAGLILLCPTLYLCPSSVQFSHSVVSDSFRAHESQHARPPCPSPIPGVHSDSCPSSQSSSHLILCHPLLLLPPIPPSIRDFSNESTLPMRWPKYWSFSFSIIPSKEIPGLISFRMD